jgi:hypothetical protein
MKNETPPNDSEKQKQIIFDDLSNASENITTLSRFIGFGLVALSFTLLSGTEDPLVAVARDYKTMIALIAVLGVLTILCDYLHFLFSYLTSSKARKRKDKPFYVRTEWVFRKLRYGFFICKQAIAFLGSVLALGTIAIALL